MEKRKKIILGKATKNKKIKPIETPVQNGILIYTHSDLSLYANILKLIFLM